MTVHHLRIDALDPYARGEHIGRATAGAIADNLRSYGLLFDAVKVSRGDLPAFGAAAIDRVAGWAPGLVREWEGIAAGAAVDLWQIGMLNARTEILATGELTEAAECSAAVFVPEEGAPRSVQTWDWNEALGGALYLVTHEVEGGARLRYFTEAGITGKIGLASRAGDGAVGVHLNMLRHESDGEGIGVPVHTVARRLLECADSPESAVAIARSADVSASSALTVVGFTSGRSWAVTLEISPAGVAVHTPDEGGILVQTNHFVDPGLARGDLAWKTSDTWARRTVLEQRRELLRSPRPDDRFAFLRRHPEDGAGVCSHPDPALPFEERWSTLITIDVDYERHVLRHVDAGPCRHDDLGHRTF
ncbi:C45 family autoproteolytic acyltransferase/hydolase [Rhizohabitans arisaemae]|uniref:C45 family autoproteolytic acyltransferase/hydolase n=1 Tax=Rhizohabitans arisaemae TaxID=2720610 RepID=UPI0024B052A7|nr:C45 family peptidase [Rhizohabitans arisaemae]